MRVRRSAECTIPVLHGAHVAVHHGHGIPAGMQIPLPWDLPFPASPDFSLCTPGPFSLIVLGGVCVWGGGKGLAGPGGSLLLGPHSPVNYRATEQKMCPSATWSCNKGANLSQEVVGPGTRRGVGDRPRGTGDRQKHPGCHHRAFYRTRDVCSQLSLGSGCPFVSILRRGLFSSLGSTRHRDQAGTHTVHRPVMEKADKLTGRRIQAVMREGGQDGGREGERARGRWGRGVGPSYLKALRQNHQLPRPGGKRQVKVQGPVTGQ